MRRRRAAMCSLVVCAASCAAFAGAVRAQTTRPGTLLSDGRIVVKVYVTMPQSGLYGHPVAGVHLFAVAPGGGAVETVTDVLGTSAFALAPGPYRIVSTDTVTWQGRRYSWDVPVTVRGGMGVVNLTPSNATSISAATETPRSALPRPRPARRRRRASIPSPRTSTCLRPQVLAAPKTLARL